MPVPEVPKEMQRSLDAWNALMDFEILFGRPNVFWSDELNREYARLRDELWTAIEEEARLYLEQERKEAHAS